MSKTKVYVGKIDSKSCEDLKKYLNGQFQNMTFEKLIDICREIKMDDLLKIVNESLEEITSKYLGEENVVENESETLDCVQDMEQNNGANTNDDKCLNCDDYDCFFNPCCGGNDEEENEVMEVEDSNDIVVDCLNTCCHECQKCAEYQAQNVYDDEVEEYEDEVEEYDDSEDSEDISASECLSLDEKIEKVVPEIDKFCMADLNVDMDSYNEIMESYERDLGSRILQLGNIINYTDYQDLKEIRSRMEIEYQKLTSKLNELYAQQDVLEQTKTYADSAMEMLNDYIDSYEDAEENNDNRVDAILADIKEFFTAKEIDDLITALQRL